MKLTPLDIHHKEFRHSLRGYAEEEVDQFLDEVADEFERLFKENIELSERLEAANQKLNEFELQRQTINNTLMAAQRSAEDITERASKEAADVLREAETKAKEIIHNALSKKQQVANELIRIKQAEEQFRASYRSLLEGNLRSISEVELPADVDVLLGETNEGVVGDVAVRPAAEPAHSVQAPVPVTAPEPQPAAEPIRSEESEQGIQPTTVSSVAFGEVAEPELPAGVTLVEPTEFSLPTFEVLGERDEDDEIEEID